MYDNMSVDPEKKEQKPSAHITIHKDHASKMAVGNDVEMHVKGKIKGVNQSYDKPDHYDVDLEDVETTPKDEAKEDKENMATMPREKLKKKIMQSSDEE